MAGSDPPSQKSLDFLHWLQDEAHYGRTYPATAWETQQLGWYFIKRRIGWPVDWPIPLLEGFAGGTQLVGDVAGVTTIAKLGSAGLTGDVTLSGGTGIVLTQAGQNIAIANSSPGSLGGCAVFRTTATPNIPTSTITAVTFDNEQFDDSGYHDNAVNPSRLTVPATGVYSITGSGQWDANTVGTRGLWFQLNGTDTAATRLGGTYGVGTGGAEMQSVPLVIGLTAGDFVELMAFQTSGGNRTLTVSSSRPRFAIYRLA